jgi:hypothetical protein
VWFNTTSNSDGLFTDTLKRIFMFSINIYGLHKKYEKYAVPELRSYVALE